MASDPVLVAGWIGARNVGDELIHAEVRRALRDRGHEAVAISESPDDTRRTHGDAIDLRAAPAALRRCSGFVLGGGGLLQDTTSTLNVVRHGLVPWGGRIARRPGLAIGLGLGPLSTPIGRRLSRRVLSSVGGPVVVRDASSLDLATSIGVERAELGCDLVFDRTVAKSVARRGIVVSLRPRLRHRRDMDNDDADIAAWADVLDILAASTDAPISFVAMDERQDTPFHAAVAERMSHPSEQVVPDLSTIDGIFAGAELVVAMRYHAAVMGLVSDTAVVLAPYAPKVAALVDEFDLDGCRLDLDEIAALPTVAERAIDAGSTSWRERLDRRRQVNRTAFDRFAELLVD